MFPREGQSATRNLIRSLQSEYEKAMKTAAKLLRKGSLADGEGLFVAADKLKARIDKLKEELS